jgi:hypothetical protein
VAASSFVSQGSVVATGTTAPAGYPSSFAAGDLLLLVVSSDSASIGLTVAGWTSLGPVQTGGGVSVVVWSKIATGSETGTVSVSITGGTKGVAYTVAYRTGGTQGIGAVLYRSGSDTDTSSTAYSAAGASATLQVDDRVVAATTMLAAAAGTFSAIPTGPAVTVPGATVTSTSRFGARVATNTMAYNHSDAAVTAAGSGAPTFAATGVGANAAGSTAFVVIREVPNVPPTATITANQTVAASANVTASVSASDSDGTIASYAWTGTRYTATAEPASITLTGAATDTVTYTAPAATGVLDVLTCVVTDNSGGTVTKTTEVRIPTTGDILPLRGAGTGVGSWTNTGGAASEGAALADASNTTYLESPTLSASEVSKRVRLAPAVPRIGATLTTQVSQDVAGTIVAKVRLLEGAALRQEQTLTTTTSAADQVFTLNTGTIAAITDWGNLFLEWAGTA